ncbi:MAG: DUF1491 family protein [Pseudomonadota bacterium]
MVIRLRSDVIVSGLQRQCEAAGLMFMVLDRGHEEGGLVLIKWIDGTAVQIFREGTVNDRRRWTTRGAPIPEADAATILAKERGFDADAWVLEVIGPMAKADKILEPVAEA